MKYLFAVAMLLSTPGVAGPKVDDALDQLSDVYGRLMAIAVTCDLEAELPKDPLGRVATAVATMGQNLSPRARTLLKESATKELRTMPALCDDKLRNEFAAMLGYWDRNLEVLSTAIRAERGY